MTIKVLLQQTKLRLSPPRGLSSSTAFSSSGLECSWHHVVALLPPSGLLSHSSVLLNSPVQIKNLKTFFLPPHGSKCSFRPHPPFPGSSVIHHHFSFLAILPASIDELTDFRPHYRHLVDKRGKLGQRLHVTQDFLNLSPFLHFMSLKRFFTHQ